MTTHLEIHADGDIIATTLDAFLADNELDTETVAAIRALPPGGRFDAGGGAACEWSVIRVREPISRQHAMALVRQAVMAHDHVEAARIYRDSDISIGDYHDAIDQAQRANRISMKVA